MLSIYVSAGLFVLTMIIIILLRISDNKTRSVANVKKMVEQIQGEVQRFDSSLKKEIAEIEVEIDKDTAQVRDLIQTVAAQIVELKSYSNDFDSLQESMVKYQNALVALARLTEDNDAKTDELKKQVLELENQISGFSEKSDSISSVLQNAVENALNTCEDIERRLEEAKKPFGADFDIQDMDLNGAENFSGEKLDDDTSR